VGPSWLDVRRLCGICLAVCILIAGCAAPRTGARVAVKAEIIDANRTYETVYLLQPGDQLDVSVYRHADLSRKMPVRPDGYISIPLLKQDVFASGKSPRDLSNEIATALAQRIRDPEVSVIVENAQEPVIYVVGEAGTPRAIPLRQARTAAQAIAQAGPLPKSASLANVSVIRVNGEGQLQAYSVDAPGSAQPDVYLALNAVKLQPNDLIVIPESYRGQVMRAVTDINSMINPYLQLRVLRVLSQ
jgi:polysaccharide export outer membrane protein